MRKGGLTTIEARPKLRTTTKDLGDRNNERPDMRRETLPRDSTKHNITIPTGKKGGTFILKQLLQHTTTPLKGGESKQADLKIKGKYKHENTLGNLLQRIPRILSSPPAPRLAFLKDLAKALSPGTTDVTPIPELWELRSRRDSKVF